MSDTTPLSTINYDAILHELTKPRAYSIRQFREQMSLDTDDCSALGSALSEMNTFWIGVPRQRGKTDWIAKLLKQELDSIAISINLPFKASLLARMDEPFDESRLYTVCDIKSPKVPIEEQTPRGLKLVMIDDAVYVLERIKRKTLFEWIAHHGSEDTRVIMLVT